MTSDHISPIKCALKFKPPMLAITYKDLNTGKTRRRTIPLRGFVRVNNVEAYGDKLLRNAKHCDYVSKLPRKQLNSLLQRVMENNKENTGSPDHTPTPSPIHSSLAGLPSLTGFPSLTTHTSRPTLNQEFEEALDELLGPEDDEDVLDVTIPDISGLPRPSSLTNNSSSLQPSSISSPLGKLPPLSRLPPLNPLKEKDNNVSTVKQHLKTDSAPEENEIPDYSADFNSESEKSTMASQNQPPPAKDDKSLSFAIEELDDDDSLALSIEGENLAGDHLLGSFSGEDFRLMNIVTPPPQMNGVQSSPDEDLNKANDAYLAQRKEEMESVFQAHQSKPGDQDYVYDKELDFDAPKIESGWDSDDSISDF